jgi:hypothetical protein
MSDIKRLRSTRLDKHLSNTMKRARASRIIDGPEGIQAGGDAQLRGGMQIVQERDHQNDPDNVTLATNSLALDDIARMAALEQQREQRPNAFRAGGSALLGQNDQPRFHNGHRRDFSGGQELQNMTEGRSRTYFSELSPLEYFKLKGLAVLQLGLLLDDNQYNQGDLLDLIESKKNNFWGKIGFGKAKNKPKKPTGVVEKPVSDKATFRQSLEYLVEKFGADCTEGVGPGALKVPALLENAITAMRSMDMSIEGVFRKNGNLKALRELEEEIDARGVDQVDLNSKNPVILANLLKRFLRLMPDPVLTLKLYRLFMVANGEFFYALLWIKLTGTDIEDEEQRKKVLHLVLALLPKAHRETMEVLFRFLNWVSSFHTVDEESGNKMDTWNIATVMAPNILRESNDKEMRNVDQGAVKVVFDLIENNDEFSEARTFTSVPMMTCAHRSRYLPRSWNFSMTTHRRTCPPKKSCGNGSREARIRSQLPQRHRRTRVAQRRRRTSGMHHRSHLLTATLSPTPAKHRCGTWDPEATRKPPRTLTTHLRKMTWEHQTHHTGGIHKTRRRATGLHRPIDKATDHLLCRNKHRLVQLAQGDLQHIP